MQGFFFAESKNGEKNVMKCADGVKNKIRPLFAGFYDSLMFSYFDGVFGTAFCDDTTHGGGHMLRRLLFCHRG